MRTGGEYARRYLKSHPGHAGEVFAAQCGCSHWVQQHCAECGACQECDCPAFKGE